MLSLLFVAALLGMLLVGRVYPDEKMHLSIEDSNVLGKELSPECKAALEGKVDHKDLSDDCKSQLKEINDVLSMTRNRVMSTRPPVVEVKKWYRHPVTYAIFGFVALLGAAVAGLVVYVNNQRGSMQPGKPKKVGKKKVSFCLASTPEQQWHFV